MTTHIMDYHNCLAPLVCSLCDNTFPTFLSIKNHKCPFFSGRVPEICNICHWDLTSNRTKDPVTHIFRCKNTNTLSKPNEVFVKQEEFVKKEIEVNKYRLEENVICSKIDMKNTEQRNISDKDKSCSDPLVERKSVLTCRFSVEGVQEDI